MEKLALQRLLQRLKDALKVDHLVTDACITIYCIKALVWGLKGIAFHGKNEIIYMYCKSSNKPPPPSEISPLLLISPPFSGEERVSYKPLSSPSIKQQVQMGQVACLYHKKKGPAWGYCCAASILMGCKFIAHFPTHMPFLIYFLGGV